MHPGVQEASNCGQPFPFPVAALPLPVLVPDPGNTGTTGANVVAEPLPGTSDEAVVAWPEAGVEAGAKNKFYG